MAKTFIPLTIKLDEKEIERIKATFPFLGEEDFINMEYWNSPGSPYPGIIVDKDAQYNAYPYDSLQGKFLQEYPDGTIWK